MKRNPAALHDALRDSRGELDALKFTSLCQDLFECLCISERPVLQYADFHWLRMWHAALDRTEAASKNVGIDGFNNGEFASPLGGPTAAVPGNLGMQGRGRAG